MTAAASHRRRAPLDLVDRAASGDPDAFLAIVRRYDDRLRALAYKLLGGDHHAMEDVLQEAYIHAYRALPQFRREANFATWLYRITYNACIDELRRGTRRPRPLDGQDAGWEAADATPGHEARVTDTDATLRALATLPPDQRTVVLLVDGEGFDYGTVAEVLDVAPGTVKSRLSRARAALRRELERGAQ